MTEKQVQSGALDALSAHGVTTLHPNDEHKERKAEEESDARDDAEGRGRKAELWQARMCFPPVQAKMPDIGNIEMQTSQ